MHERHRDMFILAALLGPKRTAIGVLLGCVGGIIFWIIMGILIAMNQDDPQESKVHMLTYEEIQQERKAMYGKWSYCARPSAHEFYPGDCP